MDGNWCWTGFERVGGLGLFKYDRGREGEVKMLGLEMA